MRDRRQTISRQPVTNKDAHLPATWLESARRAGSAAIIRPSRAGLASDGAHVELEAAVLHWGENEAVTNETCTGVFND